MVALVSCDGSGKSVRTSHHLGVLSSDQPNDKICWNHVLSVGGSTSRIGVCPLNTRKARKLYHADSASLACFVCFVGNISLRTIRVSSVSAPSLIRVHSWLASQKRRQIAALRKGAWLPRSFTLQNASRYPCNPCHPWLPAPSSIRVHWCQFVVRLPKNSAKSPHSVKERGSHGAFTLQSAARVIREFPLADSTI